MSRAFFVWCGPQARSRGNAATECGETRTLRPLLGGLEPVARDDRRRGTASGSFGGQPRELNYAALIAQLLREALDVRPPVNNAAFAKRDGAQRSLGPRANSISAIRSIFAICSAVRLFLRILSSCLNATGS